MTVWWWIRFLRKHFRLFDVPSSVAQDLRRAGVGVKDVSPAMVRRFLREQSLRTLDMVQTSSLGLELLVFCLSDAEPGQVRSCRSAPLV